jgi:hypothetical protein
MPVSAFQLFGGVCHSIAGILGCIDRIGRIGTHATDGICATGKRYDSKDSGDWSNV